MSKFKEVTSYTLQCRKGRFLRQQPLYDSQIGLIIGTVLGDARLWVSSYAKHSEASLSVTHCDKQLEYVKLLRKLFDNICIKDIRSYEVKGKVYHSLNTIRHPGLTPLQKMFYPDGKKIVTQPILDLLTIPGLVLWYYDDGSFQTGQYRIASCSFSLEEHHLIRSHLFRKFGIKTTPLPVNNGKKKYWSLVFAKDTRPILEKYLLDFYLPCMAYKIRPSLLCSSETTREQINERRHL